MDPVDVFWMLPRSPNFFADLAVVELGINVHESQRLLCDRWAQLDMHNDFCIEYWISIHLARKVIIVMENLDQSSLVGVDNS
jgi:hypothetical protein